MTTYTATYSPDDNKLRLTASARLDAETYARVKAAGFAWAPKQEQFIAPMWTPAREDLCIELAGQIDDADGSLIERAADRAERFEDYSDKRAAESERATDHVRSIADGIPFGQPILVGHHSERRARKDAERIESGMRRAVQLFDTAEYWKRRAAAAVAHAEYKERADVRHRRIKGIEADLRKVRKTDGEAAKWLAAWELVAHACAEGKPEAHAMALHVANVSGYDSRCFPLADYPRDPPASQYEGPMGLWSALDGGVITAAQAAELGARGFRGGEAHRARWIQHYENRIAYERAMLAEAGGIAAEAFDLQPGGTITHRGRRSVILRVNKSGGAVVSVSVTGQGWTVGVEEITSYEPASEAAAAAVAALMKPAPLCNYPGRNFVHMTQAQWKDISSDYKSTRDMGAAVDATNGGQRYDTLKDYRAGSECYTRHRVRVAMGASLRRVIGPEAWDEMVAACSAMHERQTNTVSGMHPVYIVDAKAKEPERIDAPPRAPRKTIARKIAEAAGVGTARHAEPEAIKDADAKTEARAVLAELTAQAAPRPTHTAPPPSDSRAEIDAMRASLKSGVQVVSAPQLFPTPATLAARMVDLADIKPGARVLEPSAGTGRIVDAIVAAVPLDRITLDCIEVRRDLADRLRKRHPGAIVRPFDFLQFDPNAAHLADAVLMNPPFANGADVDHVTHAVRFLKPGGRLVAIMSAGVTFRNDRKTRDLRRLVASMGGDFEELPPDTFASSGTGVRTVLVVLDAPERAQANPPADHLEAAPAVRAESDPPAVAVPDPVP